MASEIQDVSVTAPRAAAAATAGIHLGSLLLPARWLANALALAAGDGLALFAALAASQLVRWGIGLPMRIPVWFALVAVLWWIAAVGVRALPGWGLGIVRERRRIVLLLPVVFAAGVSLIYLSRARGGLTRLELAITFLVSLALVPHLRTKVKYLLIRLRLWGMPTVVYGDLESARTVLAALRREPGLGYVPIAVCDGEGVEAGSSLDGVPVVERSSAQIARIPTAIVATASPARESLLSSAEGHLSRYRHVLVIPRLTLAGCSRPPDRDRPERILLISLDTLRADRIHAYGYARETTPFLDRLAAEGARFDAHFSQSVSTLPSHASVFLSQYLAVHGVNDGGRITDSQRSLVEELAAAGFATAGFVSGGYVSERFGFNRGFQGYEVHRQKSPMINRRALEWLRNGDPRKRFLFLHYMTAHGAHR